MRKRFIFLFAQGQSCESQGKDRSGQGWTLQTSIISSKQEEEKRNIYIGWTTYSFSEKNSHDSMKTGGEIVRMG